MVLFIWLIMGLIGYAIGNGKGRGTAGFFLGLFLGFIGWIIVLLLSPAQNTIQVAQQPKLTHVCPYCRSSIDPRASICAVCKKEITPTSV